MPCRDGKAFVPRLKSLFWRNAAGTGCFRYDVSRTAGVCDLARTRGFDPYRLRREDADLARPTGIDSYGT